MNDVAASLTYYAMMSLFPGIVIATSLFSLIGDASTVTDAVDYLARHGADATTQSAVSETMQAIVKASGGAVTAALAVSFLFALNGASGAFAAAGRALNRVYGVEEDRSFVRRKALDVGMTLVIVALLLVTLAAMFLAGGVAGDLLRAAGLGGTGPSVWSYLRWPIALAAALLAYALIFAFAPDRHPRRFRWISPGSVAGVTIWVVASIGFGVYLRHFSSYGAAYGAAGAAIALLLWLWISSCAFLLGAELNAELEHAQTAGRGGPPPPSPPPSPERPVPYPSAPPAAREAMPDRHRTGSPSGRRVSSSE